MQYFLELCLQSVVKATQNIPSEIIVADNNSADNSCSMVANKFPQVKLIKNNRNLGFSKGNNLAVQQAQGKYICILNPDTVVAESTFENLINFAQKTSNIGALGCKLIDGSGNFLPESKRNIPTVPVALQKTIGLTKKYYANQVYTNQVAPVSILVGACMLLKKEVYLKVAGFDEDYFMYGEDIDLSYKLLKAGYQNYYYGKETIIHFKGESTLKDATYAKRFYGAMQIFYQKHFKKNYFFDVLVYLGIQASRLHFSTKKTKNNKPEKYYLYTNEEKLITTNNFPFTVSKFKNISNVLPNAEIILDANSFSFKEIILFINSNTNTNNITFKILPINTNFLIGSNNAKSQGEVVVI